MSTNDVPGAKPANRDVLAMGCWAEHNDGSLIFVESVEGDSVVYSMFDLALDPPVEYRDAMPIAGFKKAFTWKPEADDDDLAAIQWTWHDKTPMPWDRVMAGYPSGPRAASADATRSAADRVAESLRLRAQEVSERHSRFPTPQRAASAIMHGIREAVGALR